MVFAILLFLPLFTTVTVKGVQKVAAEHEAIVAQNNVEILR